MTKIDIISGFLGAGKTTLIKKLLAEAFPGEKLVLIENEFGEISIDGGFLKESGVQISEMSSGCICCSLVGDFNKALKEVADQFHPDRILIEPSGVGKLSDVIVAVENTVADVPEMKLNSFVTVADATKVKVYMKNFGEFYNNQIEAAGAIILSRTQKLTQEKLEAAVALLREKNPDAAILTTPWDTLDGKVILSAMEKVSLADELLAKMREEHEAEEAEHEHHHHHDHDHEEHEHHHHGHDEDDDDDDEHEHHHHHHDDDDEDEHEHHHYHDHDHEEHEHHHDHGHECDDPDCSCHHHHHHHADEVFTSWGKETPKSFTQADIARILTALDSGEYGKILRAKGIVSGENGAWIEFDYVPEEHDVRAGHPDYTGRLCVIGAELKEDKLAELFGL
ncbi:CobW family GTP-binding protein [Oscillibacter sp.]|uniref:CobW family GTP-binding protein n=1 Tax=Oscillibacter sp. TaxID=1945593 RepID=UPI001B6AA58D|nr:CobW family GTP-binding protein [Oscillibacter sp.]MBP3508839.1 GTP-binding protein [Oscillibacter sp.]